MYCVDGAQRGPLPSAALLKLWERGVVPMDRCAVWTPGAAGWCAPSDAPALRERAALVRCQFFVADATAPDRRSGPFPLGELRRKFDGGEVDGLTAVYAVTGTAAAAWAPIGEVPGLRALLVVEEAPEEEEAGLMGPPTAAAAAAAAASTRRRRRRCCGPSRRSARRFGARWPR